MVDDMKNLQIRSLVTAEGELHLSLDRAPTPEPAADEIVVRIQATPINPSDLGLLLSGADMANARATGSSDSPRVTARVPDIVMQRVARRVGLSLPVGNEGAGVVVKAGPAAEAQALMGKLVAIAGGAMYSELRVVKAKEALILPSSVTAADGASCFVNPLTALGMVETMRRDGHTALVHTAAASNLGQMLTKICLKDGIKLVNIVRSPEQAALQRSIGAEFVVDSSAPSFIEQLTSALSQTGATIAFDAIGGGQMTSQILSAMEVAANATATTHSIYGSDKFKQVYIYGNLDTGPTVLNRSFGAAWGIGGWLLTPFLQKVGAVVAAQLRARVVSELKTTFASHYTRVVSLREALSLDAIHAYSRRATGEKFLIDPTL